MRLLLKIDYATDQSWGNIRAMDRAGMRRILSQPLRLARELLLPIGSLGVPPVLLLIIGVLLSVLELVLIIMIRSLSIDISVCRTRNVSVMYENYERLRQ